VTISLADGSERVSYTRFHVLLRRTDGRWRIVADYDSPAESSAEAFVSARALASD
jgi:ketosteroid isomerase-like protein